MRTFEECYYYQTDSKQKILIIIYDALYASLESKKETPDKKIDSEVLTRFRFLPAHMRIQAYLSILKQVEVIHNAGFAFTGAVFKNTMHFKTEELTSAMLNLSTRHIKDCQPYPSNFFHFRNPSVQWDPESPIPEFKKARFSENMYSIGYLIADIEYWDFCFHWGNDYVHDHDFKFENYAIMRENLENIVNVKPEKEKETDKETMKKLGAWILKLVDRTRIISNQLRDGSAARQALEEIYNAADKTSNAPTKKPKFDNPYWPDCGRRDPFLYTEKWI